jgi:uncharacterized membrane protein
MNMRIKTILVISLLCNLGMIAFVAGYLMGPGRFGFHPPLPPGMGPHLMGGEGKERDLMRDFFDDFHQESRPLIREIEEAKSASVIALRQEPFDRDSFHEQGKKIHELSSKLHQSFAERFEERIATMTKEERERFARHLQQMPPLPPPGF